MEDAIDGKSVDSVETLFSVRLLCSVPSTAVYCCATDLKGTKVF